MFATAEFLNLEHTAHPKLFENQNYVWDALKQIASYLQFRLKPGVLGQLVGKPFLSNHVFIGRGTIVEQGAVLKGPAWIGENCQIRSGCYVRENVIVGDGVVMGNSCEFKNCILFDEAQVPHFNYV
ncbi:MAG: UDP-N-acetylglucosamine diphosphorylase, partial [Verrucomicrobia bacterium]